MRNLAGAINAGNILLLICLSGIGVQALYAQTLPQSPLVEDLESAVTNYRDRLDELQAGYSPETTEVNLDLAAALSRLERHDEAAAAYEQALQNQRIRDGLYSESQLQILESAIESAMSGQRWSLVDRNFYLALSILEHSVAITDPRFEKWVRWFTHWSITTHRNQLELSEDNSSLQDALAYYELLESGLEESDPDYLAKKLIYTREKSLAHYFTAIAISATPYDEFSSQAPQTTTGQRCYVVMRNGQPTTICNSTQVPNPEYFESRQEAKTVALQRQVRSILGSYQELISELESDPSGAETLATVTLELAEMNFMLRDRQQANALFLRAHQILVDAGLADTVGTALMSQPREIISNLLDPGLSPAEPLMARPTGLVSFDVSAEGRVDNLVIMGQGEDLEAENQELIADRLRRSVYRPRLLSGQPVDARLELVPAAEL
jgi:tetratricopeptide (TPR) repeat protein